MELRISKDFVDILTDKNILNFQEFLITIENRPYKGDALREYLAHVDDEILFAHLNDLERNRVPISTAIIDDLVRRGKVRLIDTKVGASYERVGSTVSKTSNEVSIVKNEPRTVRGLFILAALSVDHENRDTFLGCMFERFKKDRANFGEWARLMLLKDIIAGYSSRIKLTAIRRITRVMNWAGLGFVVKYMIG